jgi:hypothetical protein
MRHVAICRENIVQFLVLAAIFVYERKGLAAKLDAEPGRVVPGGIQVEKILYDDESFGPSCSELVQGPNSVPLIVPLLVQIADNKKAFVLYHLPAPANSIDSAKITIASAIAPSTLSGMRFGRVSGGNSPYSRRAECTPVWYPLRLV